jgi:hypothetical protein
MAFRDWANFLSTAAASACATAIDFPHAVYALMLIQWGRQMPIIHRADARGPSQTALQ